MSDVTHRGAKGLGCAACAVLILSFATGAFAQSGALDVQGREPTASAVGEVGRPLDDFLERATTAAEAAGLVAEADSYRKGADGALAVGRRDEARALLRRAGEALASAAPDGDAKRDDPFLRQYLAEVTAALLALDAPPADDGNALAAGMPPSGRTLRGFRVAGARLASYRPMMSRIFREEGVPEWLLAVGLVESGYSTSALSPKGALGIWQFIPSTADRFGLARSATFDERQDPEKSTRAAARYLRTLYALFGDWPLAIAAYNAGEGRIARVMRQTGVRDFDGMAVRGLLPQETIDYVPRVLAAARSLAGPAR